MSEFTGEEDGEATASAAVGVNDRDQSTTPPEHQDMLQHNQLRSLCEVLHLCVRLSNGQAFHRRNCVLCVGLESGQDLDRAAMPVRALLFPKSI